MAIRQQSKTVIDIGSHAVKIVQCAKSGRIIKQAVEKIPEGTVKGLFIEAEEPLIRAIKTAKRKSGAPGGPCTLTLSGKDLIVRHLNLPMLQEKQLYQNVLLEMASYLPVDIEKQVIDYKILEEVQENDTTLYRILVATIHRNLLERFTFVLKKAGFTLKTLDANENAQEKFVRSSIHTLLNDYKGKGICIIDMGAETTNVNLFNEGRFFAGYLLNRGGAKITALIAQYMQTDVITAENFKMKSDLFYDTDINLNLQAAVKNEIDSLIYELSKVADYFWSRTGKPLGCIVLSGGGALLKGLLKYMQSSVNIPLLEPKTLLSNYTSPNMAAGLSFYLNAYAASFREEAK